MKSALLLSTLACFLSGVPPSHAAQGHRHSRPHLQKQGQVSPGLHLLTATRPRRHLGHLKHAHYAARRHGHILPATVPYSQPEAEASLARPNAITGLPLPPDGTPEFGNATTQAQTSSLATADRTEQTPDARPEKSIRVEVAAVSTAPVLSAVTSPAPPAPPTKPAVTPPNSPIASEAPASAPTATKPGSTAPEPLPTPVAPKARFNQPTAVPLPEPAAIDPASESVPIVTPEHEDDDQPIAATSGVGYIGLAKVNHTRPFPTPTPMRGYDVAASGVGIFTHSLTSSAVETSNAAAGLLLSFHHATTRPWLDLEAHFGFNKNSAQYAAVGTQPALDASVLAQEFTADLLLRRHLNRARPYRMLPYVGAGGGLLYFRQSSTQTSQLAPAALLDSGIDIPTDSQHLSFRVGSHLLLYPTPEFGAVASSGWTISVQPAAGMLFHF